MQLTNIIFFLVLAMSMVTTRTQAENEKQELTEKKTNRQITKREASVIIDNFPVESILNKKQKVIYRRISKQRYHGPKSKNRPPKTKYGPPTSERNPSKPKFGLITAKKYGVPSVSKYGSPKSKPDRHPFRKFKSKNIGPKYGAPTLAKKRSPKPKYGSPKPAKIKSTYSPPKKHTHYSHNSPEPAGFGEPPADYSYNIRGSKVTNADPAVDSYGAPLRTAELYSTAEASFDTSSHPENQDVNLRPMSWQTPSPIRNIDNGFAYSKKHPSYTNPNANVFDISLAMENHDIYDSESFKYKNNDINKNPQNVVNDKLKYLNKPWNKPSSDDIENDNQIVVGGQYAEPPARYASKFIPSAPMYFGNDYNFYPPYSSYVNYKNSNMAFSPQNLNDAFSVIDK